MATVQPYPAPVHVSRARLVHGLWVAWAVVLLAAPAVSQASSDRTVTVIFGGFHPGGAKASGDFGVDSYDPLLGHIATLAHRPTILTPGGAMRPDLITGCEFYGDTAPAYYDAADRAELEQLTQVHGGGIPRYASICAKFIRHVLERTGAEQANVIGPSMGALVTRWMLEKDLEGLMSTGRIARWITYEGILNGHWIASRAGPIDLAARAGLLPIDIVHMDYGWIEEHLHDPHDELDGPLFAGVQMGHVLSTRDSSSDGALTTALYLLDGGFAPNDGVVLLRDGLFDTVTPRSRFGGRLPTVSYMPVGHDEAAGHPGVWAHVATALDASRRVTLTLRGARMADLKEAWWPWLNDTAEVVFTSTVRSPWWEQHWSVSDAMSTRDLKSGVSPVVRFGRTGHWSDVDLVLFDDFVPDGETSLLVQLGAWELDWDPDHQVLEYPHDSPAEAYAPIHLVVPLDGPATSLVQAVDWQGRIEMSVTAVPSGLSLYLTEGNLPDRATASASGQAVPLTLAAGPGQAGSGYLLLGSLSGSAPGTPLPGGRLPLNWDGYTTLLLRTLDRPLHQGFSGTLDEAGRATATFNAQAMALPAVAVGLSLSLAAVLRAPETGSVIAVTNPVHIDLVP